MMDLGWKGIIVRLLELRSQEKTRGEDAGELRVRVKKKMSLRFDHLGEIKGKKHFSKNR